MQFIIHSVFSEARKIADCQTISYKNASMGVELVLADDEDTFSLGYAREEDVRFPFVSAMIMIVILS
jgi:hypothetical protein